MLRMKYQTLGLAASIGIFVMVLSVLNPTVATAQEIDLPAGTPLMLTFSSTIDPAAVRMGEAVTLTVLQAVLVDGKTLIAAGALVSAEVTNSQKHGNVGRPGIIGVKFLSVVAVDGTRVPISGQKYVEGENKQATSIIVTIFCLLGLLMDGGPVQIAAGSQSNAMTMGTVAISAMN